MVDNPDVPVLNVVVKDYLGLRQMREIDRIVNRLKFIYVDRYNVVTTCNGMCIAGTGMTQLIIGKDCDFEHILQVLDGRITEMSIDKKEEPP